MLEIVSRISTWAGGENQAMAWYRAQPIAAFGDRTAESLLKSGQAAAAPGPAFDSSGRLPKDLLSLR
jgi:uroporphyrinogen-III synthase